MSSTSYTTAPESTTVDLIKYIDDEVVGKINMEIKKDYFLVGRVQSGKTGCIIKIILKALMLSKIPVVFLNNFTEDKIQIKSRIAAYIANLKNDLSDEDIEKLSRFNFVTSEEFKNGNIDVMYNNCYLLLSNYTDVAKFVTHMNNCDQKNDFVLIFDECDLTIKNEKTKLMMNIYKINMDCCRVFVTATALAYLVSNKVEIERDQLINLGITDWYKGIDDIHKDVIENNYDGIKKTMKNITTFDSARLRNRNGKIIPKMVFIKNEFINDRQEDQKNDLMNYLLTDKFEVDGIEKENLNKWISILYNSKGVIVNFSPLFTNIRVKEYRSEKPISKVLSDIKKQLVNINANLQYTSIMIIGNRCLERGISVVCQEYEWHIIHEILVGNINNCSTAIQSLRILGNYNDNIELTLYCSATIKEMIKEYNYLQAAIIEGMVHKTWSNKKLMRCTNMYKKYMENMIIGKDLLGEEVKLKYMNIGEKFTPCKERYEKYMSQNIESVSVERILRLWWGASTIRGKTLKFIYENNGSVSVEELKEFLSSIGSRDIIGQIGLFIRNNYEEYKIYVKIGSTVSLRMESLRIIEIIKNQ